MKCLRHVSAYPKFVTGSTWRSNPLDRRRGNSLDAAPTASLRETQQNLHHKAVFSLRHSMWQLQLHIHTGELHESRYLVVVTRLRAGWFRVRVPGQQTFVPKRSDQLWEPPSLLFNGHRGSLPRVKGPGRAADHSPPSGAGLTASPLHNFMARTATALTCSFTACSGGYVPEHGAAACLRGPVPQPHISCIPCALQATNLHTNTSRICGLQNSPFHASPYISFYFDAARCGTSCNGTRNFDGVIFIAHLSG
jgi:hypothetical protein